MGQYKDIIIPSGSTYGNAKITGFGVSFPDAKQNQFDMGIRQAKFGEFDITAVVDRSKEDTAPFVQPKNINGFSVKIGTIVNIRTTKDVVNSIPIEEIIYTQTTQDTRWNTNTANTNKSTTKSIFTPKNIIIGLVVFGAVFGILKWQKVI